MVVSPTSAEDLEERRDVKVVSMVLRGEDAIDDKTRALRRVPHTWFQGTPYTATATATRPMDLTSTCRERLHES